MKMLRLDRELVDDLRAQHFEDVDVDRLLRRRSGYHSGNDRNDWGNEYRRAVRDLVYELTRH
jgi:hypothetical protein